MKKTILYFLLIINTYLYCEDTIKKEFVCPESNNRIIYEGELCKGNGKYYVYENEIKRMIVDEYIKYDPIVKWYGKDLAEIFIATGSPFYHSYFYNFKNKHLSASYNFVIYVDLKNEYVITCDDGKLVVYDLRTDKTVKEYKIDDRIEPCSLLVFAKYSIDVINNKLKFNYSIDTKDEKWNIDYMFDYNF
jgi:hypothetical protein